MNVININARIRVILSKEGAKWINVLNEQKISEILNNFPKVDTDFIKTDYVEGDILEDSMWYIFSIFGNYFSMTAESPFENNNLYLLN